MSSNVIRIETHLFSNYWLDKEVLFAKSFSCSIWRGIINNNHTCHVKWNTSYANNIIYTGNVAVTLLVKSVTEDDLNMNAISRKQIILFLLLFGKNVSFIVISSNDILWRAYQVRSYEMCAPRICILRAVPDMSQIWSVNLWIGASFIFGSNVIGWIQGNFLTWILNFIWILKFLVIRLHIR